MHIWVGLSCEASAALGPPGFHTTAPENSKRLFWMKVSVDEAVFE